MRWPRARAAAPSPTDALLPGRRAGAQQGAPGPARRSRRDRHGRGLRGPLAWPQVPAMTTRGERFDDAVLDAMERIGPKLGDRLEGVDVAVQLVPDVRRRSLASVPVAETFTAAGPDGRRTRVVLYRRPLEARATTETDLAELVSNVLVEQLAQLFFLDPYDLDDRYEPGD